MASYIMMIWMIAAAVCALLVGFCFSHVDVRVAHYASLHFSHPLTGSLEVKAPILLGIEATIFATLVLLRLLHGHLSTFSRVLAVACLSSICTYAVNGLVLKVFFGVPAVYETFQGAPHLAVFAAGTPNSSFPSGHMALAGAFGGVFIYFYRKAFFPVAGLLAAGCAVLVLGTWHFVSDVLAGTFIGVSAGLLAAAVWRVHAGQVNDPDGGSSAGRL